MDRRLCRPWTRAVLAAIPLCLAPSVLPGADVSPLIPRAVLSGNPEKARARISPDGQRLAWIAPDKNDVLQVWVKTIGKDDPKIVTADKKRGIRIYHWAEDSRTILYLQDADGVGAIEKNKGKSPRSSTRTRATVSPAPRTGSTSTRGRRRSCPPAWADRASRWKETSTPAPPPW